MTIAIQSASNLFAAPSPRPDVPSDDPATAFMSSLFSALGDVDAVRAQQSAAAGAVAPPQAREPRAPKPERAAPEPEHSPLHEDRAPVLDAAGAEASQAPETPHGAPPPDAAPARPARARSATTGPAATAQRATPVAQTGAPASPQALPLAGASPSVGALAAAPGPQTAPATPATAQAGPTAAAALSRLASAAPTTRLGAAVAPAAPANASGGNARSGQAATTSAQTRATGRSRTAEGAPAGPRTHEGVEAQLARGLASALRAGKGGASITLRPEALGTVHVRLDVRDSTVHARIEASSEEAGRLLRDAAPALQQALASKGLEVTGIDVVTTSGAGADAASPDANPRQRHDSEAGPRHAPQGEPDHSDDVAAGEILRRATPLTVDASGVIRVDALV